jgi:hypothetical protein
MYFSFYTLSTEIAALNLSFGERAFCKPRWRIHDRHAARGGLTVTASESESESESESSRDERRGEERSGAEAYHRRRIFDLCDFGDVLDLADAYRTAARTFRRLLHAFW